MDMETVFIQQQVDDEKSPSFDVYQCINVMSSFTLLGFKSNPLNCSTGEHSFNRFHCKINDRDLFENIILYIRDVVVCLLLFCNLKNERNTFD